VRVNWRHRKSGGGGKNANGFAGLDHRELEPIDAYEPAANEHLHYATIVPSSDKSASADHQQQHPVIYAELASTQPPVVAADNSAW